MWNGPIFPATARAGSGEKGGGRRQGDRWGFKPMAGWDSVLTLVHAAACVTRQVSQNQRPIPIFPQTLATIHEILNILWFTGAFSEFGALMNYGGGRERVVIPNCAGSVFWDTSNGWVSRAVSSSSFLGPPPFPTLVPKLAPWHILQFLVFSDFPLR